MQVHRVSGVAARSHITGVWIKRPRLGYQPVMTRKLTWQLFAIGMLVALIGVLIAVDVQRVVGLVILCIGAALLLVARFMTTEHR